MDPDHILADAGLADVDAELQQLAVDARSAPKRVVAQLADVTRNSWPAGLAATDLPSTEKAEAPPMPGDDGCRHDDRQSGRPVAPDSAQRRPQEPIRGGQLRPLDRTTQDALVPKREIVHLEGGSGFDGC